jgi:hypothetical protein
MTHPITSIKSDGSTALALATDALATARQFSLPSAAETAGALILGAFESGVSTDIDIDLRVPIAYARGAAAWLVTEGIGAPWSPELHRRCNRLADALDTVCAAFRPATAKPRQDKPKAPKHAPSPDTITATTPLRLDIAAQVAFPDGSVSVSSLRREIGRGNLRAEMIAGKIFTTLANIDDMRTKCAVPTKAPDSSSESHGGQESPIAGSSSTAMPTDVASSARQAHLRQIAQGLRNSGRTPKKPSPTTLDESTSRNSAAVIRLKSE